FEGRSSARSWLLSIARRAVIDSYRHAAPRPRLSDVPDWQLAVELAQRCDLPGFDEGIVLLDLLASLPDDRREAFILTQLSRVTAIGSWPVTLVTVATTWRSSRSTSGSRSTHRPVHSAQPREGRTASSG
ncbi:hypothetical protein AB0N17_46360, partial [Streptomyces sp. NPDC051133]